MQEPLSADERWTPLSSPRVAILYDDVVHVDRLRLVLERLRCRVVDVFPNASTEEIEQLQHDVELVVVPLHSGRPETFERARELAGQPERRGPVLAASRPEDVAHCLERLRDSGVAGLLATDASASQIEFRLNRLLDVFPERRKYERAALLLPVDIDASGGASREWCVSLSVAGMGIASRRALEPNAELRLALRAHPDPIVLRGRVIHCLEDASSAPPFRIGVFFLAPASEDVARLEALIAAAG